MAGRKRKAGERYPSGDLRPAPDFVPELAPALWQRVRTALAEAFGDAQHGCEIGRLAAKGAFTEAEMTTGLRIGQVYRTFHRLKQQRDTPKSPAYEAGRAGSADLAEERMSVEQLEAFERTMKRAVAEWEFIDETLSAIPRNVRDAVLELCVSDRAINAGLHKDVRQVLRTVHRLWTDRQRRHKGGAEDQPPRMTAKQLLRALRLKVSGVTHVTGAPSSAVTAVDRPPERRIDPNVHAFGEVIRRLRPDFDLERVREVTAIFVAVRDRAEVRRKKATARTP